MVLWLLQEANGVNTCVKEPLTAAGYARLEYIRHGTLQIYDV